MASGVQTIRFRRPENGSAPSPAPTPKSKDTAMLQDQVRRTAKPIWTPSFSMAVRLLLLIRISAAMYANIQDCDEVYNFWEPLHYLHQGYGFQTWEVSPAFAIRSWAYISLHLLPAQIPTWISAPKRASFFAVRIGLAVVCTLCEAKFYRSVVSFIQRRVGRYTLFMMLFSAGMWNASVAFLPSSFAMYMNMLAYSYFLEPAKTQNWNRTLGATVAFAAGAIVGWPFSLAVSIPFVFEELFVLGGDRVNPGEKTSWMIKRWRNLALAAVAASLIFLPVIGIDSLAYGFPVLVPWNIIRYNIFGGASRGPELYGTEPWSFYLLNLLLNFNIVVPFALWSLPALIISYHFDRKRMGHFSVMPDRSNPFMVLGIRLAPLYVWLGILSLQAHKEERFMYPAYPLICFNAGVTIYLIRGWLENIYIKVTKSPYKASRTGLFRLTTSSIICISTLLSISRMVALWKYYHAPIGVLYRLEDFELPRVLNVTGLLPPVPEELKNDPESQPRIDLSPIKQFDLRLCMGKEWYRFPGHYHVPDGVRVDFVKSEFSGLLPTHFAETEGPGDLFWRRAGTRAVPDGLNDLNQEEPQHYVDVRTCDYLLDLDFPLQVTTPEHEPRYVNDNDVWEKVYCAPFLDAKHSPLLTRTLWMPGEAWQRPNAYGDYCLLKNKSLLRWKEDMVAVRSDNM